MIRSAQSNKDHFPLPSLGFCFLFLSGTEGFCFLFESGAAGFCFLFSHSLLLLPTTASLFLLLLVASNASQRPSLSKDRLARIRAGIIYM